MSEKASETGADAQQNNKSEENSVVSSVPEPDRQKNNINVDANDNSNQLNANDPDNDNDNDNDESSNKKQRTNYRDPIRLANIKSAIDFLLQQENAQCETSTRRNKNLKEVSRQFKIPYNTLRDNFLRATTGQVRHSSVKQVLKTRKIMMGNSLIGSSGMVFSDSSQLFPMQFPFHMAPLGMYGGPNQPLIFHPQQQQPQFQQQQQQQLQSQQQPHTMAYSLGNGPVIYCMPYNPATMQGKQAQPNFLRMSAPPNNGAAMAMPTMAAMSSFQSAATQMHMMSGNNAQFIQNPNMSDMMFAMPQRNSFSSLPPGSFVRPPNMGLSHLSFEPLPSSSSHSSSSSSFDSSEPTATGIGTLGDASAWLLPHLNQSLIQSHRQQEDAQKEKYTLSDLTKKDSSFSPFAANRPQSSSPVSPPPGDEGVVR